MNIFVTTIHKGATLRNPFNKKTINTAVAIKLSMKEIKATVIIIPARKVKLSLTASLKKYPIAYIRKITLQIKHIFE